jgi:hypothetical protein
MNIPSYTKQSLDNYINHGIAPGGFLTAVLTNDLYSAVGRADSVNREALADIVSYIYNEVPRDCYGSEEAMENHFKAVSRNK